MEKAEHEEIIELTDVVEEEDTGPEDPDETDIERAFQADGFFSEMQKLDEHPESGSSEPKKEVQEVFPGSSELLEDKDLQNLAEILADTPQPDRSSSRSDPDGKEGEFSDFPVNGDMGFEEDSEEPIGEDEKENDASTQDRVDSQELGSAGPASGPVETDQDEFDALEDFKLDLSLPEEPGDREESPGTPMGSDSPPAAPAISLKESSAGTPTHSPDLAELDRILGRVAREVLVEAAERMFSRVAEKVLKEEIARIREELKRLVEQD